jgi:YjbE family integral membrane protein
LPSHLFVLSVLQIVGIDILLSGDNAVVIAMACRSLPPRQRKIGITVGVAGALALRIIMAAAISYVLAIPFAKVVGGLLLFWIAVKVIKGEEDEGQKDKEVTSLWAAIGMVILADATMSLDNVVAIAAAARGNDPVFVLGLLVSMPLMIVGASLITALINRFPVIVWAGGALLGWIAADMIRTDPRVAQFADYPPDLDAVMAYVIPATGAGLVIFTAALLIQVARRRSAANHPRLV